MGTAAEHNELRGAPVKRCLCLMLALLLLAVMVGPARSDVINSDGYAHSGDYYWKDGIAYTRSLAWYWVDGYYKRSACNCYNVYVPGYWQGYYKYAVAKLKGEDAVVQALTDRMRTQNAMAKEQQRHSNLLELVKVSGLEGNFKFEGYFGGRAYAPVGPYYPPAANQYGFTFQQVQENYGSLLRNIPYDLLAQQAARQSDNSRSSTDQLYSALISGSADDARVREVLARMEAFKQGFRATEPQPSTRTETKVEGTGTGPAPLYMPKVPANGNAVEFVKLSGPAKCVSCHSGNKIEGKFDVTKVPEMSAEEIVTRVIPQLITHNGKPARMPKDGDPLTAAEVRQFLGGN